jgi:PTH1 family peptidyl-tRNA hydrolase
MRAVVGIGNPGAKYDGTRHNLGFAVLDRLAARSQLSWRGRLHSQVAEWRPPTATGQDLVLLLKPETFVNLSGEAVQAAMSFYQLPPTQVLVVVDDLNLKLGHLRLRDEGSAGGHNGLRDIEARVGKAYPRLRLGMGPLPPGAEQVPFVLGRFTPEEQPLVETMLERAADCVEGWLTWGMTISCKFNGPSTPPAPAVKRTPAATEGAPAPPAASTVPAPPAPPASQPPA